MKTGNEPCGLNVCKAEKLNQSGIGSDVPDVVTKTKTRKPIPAYSAKPSNDTKQVYINDKRPKRK